MQNTKSNLKLFSQLLTATFLIGCSGTTFTNEDIGTGVGASVGSVIGSSLSADNTIFTLAGTSSWRIYR